MSDIRFAIPLVKRHVRVNEKLLPVFGKTRRRRSIAGRRAANQGAGLAELPVWLVKGAKRRQRTIPTVATGGIHLTGLPRSHIYDA